MSTVTMAVTQVGPLVTIQDAGRPGWLRYGIPASGPLDRLGFAVANVACGNAADSAGLEISAGGITFIPDRSVTFGVVGGTVMIDQRPLDGSYLVRTISAGSTVHVTPDADHRWAYLAFAGQLVADEWLGSSSTHVTSQLGGGLVRAGADVRVDGISMRSELDGSFEPPHRERMARVVLGPQEDAFTARARSAFTSEPFTLTGNGDRMGIRLDGPELTLNEGLTLPSEPIVRGSIQVAGDGVATLLLSDHQTTGGYPKIATLLSVDTDTLSVAAPGAKVSFMAIDAAEAVALTRAELARRDDYLLALAAPDRTLAQRLSSKDLIGHVDELAY